MKKSLLYLAFVGCTLGTMSSCSDDKDPVILPPTITDVVKIYDGQKLELSLNGETVTGNPIVEILTDADKNVIIKLVNVIEGTKEFSIENATFDVLTKTYISKLTGEKTDNMLGLTVKVECLVEGDIMKVKVNTETVAETVVDATPIFNKMFKGTMSIFDPLSNQSVDMEQRIYLYKANGKGNETKFRVLIKNFNFGGANLGNIALDTIELKQRTTDIYAFKANDRKLKLGIINPDDKIEVTLNLNGVVTIPAEPENLNFNLDVVVPDLPAPVKVSFNGITTVESTTANIISVALEGSTEAIVDPLTTKNPYTFSVWSDTEANKLSFTPVFELSESASIASLTLKTADGNTEYKSGEAIDFSKIKNSKNDYLEVVIAAQDPNSTRTYKVVMNRLEALEQTKFTFNGQWNSNGQEGANFFEEPSGWSSSNTAAMFLNSLGMYPANTPYPITKEGAYAKVISVDTEGAFVLTVVPAVTAGTLFLGKFEVDIMNTLKSTKFGLPYRKEPVTLKGRFKYTAGPEYFMTKVEGQTVSKVPVKDKIDKGAINAVLYEVSNFDETLTGIDIYTSSKVVATAKMICETTNGFVDFSSNFEFVAGKSYDKTKKYKLAIVSSSSLEGDKFEGAPGSTLLIESLELIHK